MYDRGCGKVDSYMSLVVITSSSANDNFKSNLLCSYYDYHEYGTTLDSVFDRSYSCSLCFEQGPPFAKK